MYLTNAEHGRSNPACVTGRSGIARYLRAFFDFFGFAFWACGAGGVFSIRRSTSSGFGAALSGFCSLMVEGV